MPPNLSDKLASYARLVSSKAYGKGMHRPRSHLLERYAMLRESFTAGYVQFAADLTLPESCHLSGTLRFAVEVAAEPAAMLWNATE